MTPQTPIDKSLLTGGCPVSNWCLNEGRKHRSVEKLIEAIAARLRSFGIPLDRLTFSLRMLHPELAATTYLWRMGEEVEINPISIDLTGTEIYYTSPFYPVLEFGQTLRRTLADNPDKFPVFPDLLEQGFVDYLTSPIEFSDEGRHVYSAATKNSDGFEDWHIETIGRMMHSASLLFEMLGVRMLAETVCQTYLGKKTGSRVLSGKIHRGDSEQIDAVIWFADLRGFTSLSQRLSGEDMVSLLNDYHRALAAAVEEHGGEVLKFMGDGLLAIITYDNDLERHKACRAAYSAVFSAVQSVNEINKQREEAGNDIITFGIALHTGRLTYGNIGAPGRLDFTVIGPAVNLASRIEGFCSQLDRTVLASQDFVDSYGGDFVSLGSFRAKGVEEAVPLYGCPMEHAHRGCIVLDKDSQVEMEAA
ncbi:adenylate/guanylate cyclase domain-containing protein [Alphaproteobacteria bacterium]|nr:adenylate/guanylate cyclase domain-containing protein [Alphaproteobacteria bacterium]